MERELLILLGLFFVVGIAFAIYANLFRKDELSRLFPKTAVYDRIRLEVHQDFEPLLRSAKGFKRWWLLVRRHREIARRASRVIYGRVGA